MLWAFTETLLILDVLSFSKPFCFALCKSLALQMFKDKRVVATVRFKETW